LREEGLLEWGKIAGSREQIVAVSRSSMRGSRGAVVEVDVEQEPKARASCIRRFDNMQA
jgi:hypothetical protein